MGIDPVSLGITIALNLAMAAVTMSRTIEGPRLTDLEASVAEYGTPIPTVFGRDRVEAAAFFLEPIKEKKKKRKGKGGKYKEYTYFGTGAWIVADHEITSYDQIFIDRHLAYDRLTGDNVIELNDSGYELQTFMRFYYGTADQDVDPRMQAFIEAEDGPDTCPAFLNVAYIFLEDVPLEKVGNRYFQVGVVLTGIDGDALTYTRLDLDAGPGQQWKVSPSGRYTWANTFWVGVDVTEETIVAIDPYPETFATGAIDDDATVYFTSTPDHTILKKRADFGQGAQVVLETLPFTPTLTKIFELPNGDHVMVMATAGPPESDNVALYNITTATLTTVTNTFTFWPQYFYQDMHGDVWAVGVESGSPTPNTPVHFLRVIDTGLGNGSPDHSTATLTHGWDWSPSIEVADTAGGILLIWDGGQRFYLIDDQTYAILDHREYDTAAITNLGNYAVRMGEDFRPGLTQFWFYASGEIGSADNDRIAVSLIDAATLETIETRALSAWGAGDRVGLIQYLTAANAFISRDMLFPAPDDNQNDVILRYLTGSGGITLGDVIRYFSVLVGLIEGVEFDVSDTEDIPVTGCHFTQGPVKSFIGPLCDLYDVDCRMHDFLVEFIKRDREAVGFIETSQMVRNGDEPLYETWMIAESDVARRLFLTFTDPQADFQPNTAVAQRNLGAVDSLKELPIDMRSTVLYRDDAKQRTEQMLRRFWYGRLQSKFSYSYVDIAYECGDKINVDFDGEIVTLKIVKLTLTAGYVIDLELERDSPSLSNLSNSRGAEAVGHPPSVILIVGPTQGFILDIPQPFDAFEQSQPYILIAAAPVDQDDFWAGADIGFSTTGATDDFVAGFDGVTASDAATWGTVEGVLPGDVMPHIVDWGSELIISVQNGALLPSTEDGVIADRSVNLALIGDELVQFIDPELINYEADTYTYRVRGFLRAVQGTEWAMDSHVAGEQFLLLDTVHRHTVAASEIGVTRYYQATSIGQGATTGDITSRHFTAAAHRPLSPVATEVEYDEASGSHFVRWMRRSRVNGSLNGSDLPLGESYEEYKVTLQIDSGIERTELVTEAEFEYTSAMKVEDGIAVDSFIFGTVAQRSPSLNLDGYPADFASVS